MSEMPDEIYAGRTKTTAKYPYWHECAGGQTVKYHHDRVVQTLQTTLNSREAALRKIANLPAHDLGQAIRISREALGIKVGDDDSVL